jgi:hypothetical protein
MSSSSSKGYGTLCGLLSVWVSVLTLACVHPDFSFV